MPRIINDSSYRVAIIDKMSRQGQKPNHDVTSLALIPPAISPRRLRPNDRDMALIDSVAPLPRIPVR